MKQIFSEGLEVMVAARRSLISQRTRVSRTSTRGALIGNILRIVRRREV
jgi:hypothetical protein